MSIYSYPPAMRRLINELNKLPSIGEKSAARLAYHLMTTDSHEAFELSSALRKAREITTFCSECFALTEQALCPICEDQNRNKAVICVVEKPADVIAVERAGSYRGLYHVLHGVWSPLRGIDPGQTKMKELFSRIERSRLPANGHTPTPITEVVLATSTTVEGDATALYIANGVTEHGIRTTRIAQGIPKGGELEYADEMTLAQAMEGRRAL